MNGRWRGTWPQAASCLLSAALAAPFFALAGTEMGGGRVTGPLIDWQF